MSADARQAKRTGRQCIFVYKDDMTTRKKASKNSIKEPSKEGARFTRVALVVGFEESSQFL